MKKVIVLMGLILLFGGCQQVADVSALPEPQRSWFERAASTMGWDTDMGRGIEVRLDPGLSYPYNGFTDIAKGRIRIRFRLDRMIPCDIGGIEQRFVSVARHELCHAEGCLHDPDPSHLMHEITPCYPVD